MDLHALRGLGYMNVSEIKLAETFKVSPTLLPEIDLEIISKIIKRWKMLHLIPATTLASLDLAHTLGSLADIYCPNVSWTSVLRGRACGVPGCLALERSPDRYVSYFLILQ